MPNAVNSRVNNWISFIITFILKLMTTIEIRSFAISPQFRDKFHSICFFLYHACDSHSRSPPPTPRFPFTLLIPTYILGKPTEMIRTLQCTFFTNSLSPAHVALIQWPPTIRTTTVRWTRRSGCMQLVCYPVARLPASTLCPDTCIVAWCTKPPESTWMIQCVEQALPRNQTQRDIWWVQAYDKHVYVGETTTVSWVQVLQGNNRTCTNEHLKYGPIRVLQL